VGHYQKNKIKIRKQKDNFREKEINSLTNVERERERVRGRRMLGWLRKQEERMRERRGGLERYVHMR